MSNILKENIDFINLLAVTILLYNLHSLFADNNWELTLINSIYIFNFFVVLFFIISSRINIAQKLVKPLTFFILLTFIVNFLNSSCLVFPASFTCFENFTWSISKKEVQDVKIWYELWSKGGATPNFVAQDRLDYLSNFNWLPNWIDVYFFNKMSDYLLSLFYQLVRSVEIDLYYQKRQPHGTHYQLFSQHG